MHTYLKLLRTLQEGIDLAKKKKNKKLENDLKKRKVDLMAVVDPFLEYISKEYGADYVRFIVSYYINGNSLGKAECDAESYISVETMRRQLARYCEYYERANV